LYTVQEALEKEKGTCEAGQKSTDDDEDSNPEYIDYGMRNDALDTLRIRETEEFAEESTKYIRNWANKRKHDW